MSATSVVEHRATRVHTDNGTAPIGQVAGHVPWSTAHIDHRRHAGVLGEQQIGEAVDDMTLQVALKGRRKRLRIQIGERVVAGLSHRRPGTHRLIAPQPSDNPRVAPPTSPDGPMSRLGTK